MRDDPPIASLNSFVDHHESDGGVVEGGDDDRTMSPNMSEAVSRDLTM